MKIAKGFTLIEVLLIIAMMSVLLLAAVTTYSGSTKSFKLIDEYNNVTAIMQNARNYAVTNKEVKAVYTPGGTKSVVPERYGLKIESDRATLFADNGATPYKFDAGSDGIIKTIPLTAPYQLIALDDSGPLTMPVYVYYEIGSGNVSSFDGNDPPVDISSKKYLNFEMVDDIDDIKILKFIVLFQVTGLIEQLSEQELSAFGLSL